jgi:hypothetical protein
MYFRRPISFSLTGGTSARFFALSGLPFGGLDAVSACYTSNMSERIVPGSIATELAGGTRHD